MCRYSESKRRTGFALNVERHMYGAGKRRHSIDGHGHTVGRAKRQRQRIVAHLRCVESIQCRRCILAKAQVSVICKRTIADGTRTEILNVPAMVRAADAGFCILCDNEMRCVTHGPHPKGLTGGHEPVREASHFPIPIPEPTYLVVAHSD